MEVLARNPTLFFRLSGSFLLRLAERRFLGLLFQEPLRITRRIMGPARRPLAGAQAIAEDRSTQTSAD